MMKKYFFFLLTIVIIGCKEKTETSNETTTKQDTVQAPKEMDFKVVDSKYTTKDSIWQPFNKILDSFPDSRYQEIRPLVLDKDIQTLQQEIKDKKFNYQELVLFYMTRIRKYDRNNDKSLNSVIAINPNILEEAKQKVQNPGPEGNLMYGIPVLLKDNVDTKNMPTTAGAEALKGNQTSDDAFIVKQLKDNGALILGKANLSEWAYFFCEDCPSGYSAMGGQTLNPYGRKILDTGGSSSGSAVGVAANFAPVAVGTETSGSILSPSSQNSLVGLKPTVGVLSRGGIVPISSTLDTPGPIAKTVMDDAILFSAMTGKDSKDPATAKNPSVSRDYYSAIKNSSIKGKRFGAIKELMKDSLYVRAIQDLRDAGAQVVEFDADKIDLPNFTRLLNLDMKKDLPAYFKNYGGVNYTSVKDIVNYNDQDSTSRAPYGQALLIGVVNDSANNKTYQAIKDTLKENGKKFFDVPMDKYRLDGIISINNYHAGFAAVAQYPAITVPMGYAKNNAPEGLTFIGKPFQEQELLKWAYNYEQASKRRKSPENYQE